MEKIITTKSKIKSLYVHIPFCKNICSYCNFAKLLYVEKNVISYLKTLKKEIISLKKQKYKTIYIGGGTPSSLPFSHLNDLLMFLNKYLRKNNEFSIELNVEDINEELLKILKNNHINRISIGVQTLNDKYIQLINRHHNSQMVKKNIQLAKKYFNNINVDLMYGFPNQTFKELQEDVKNFLELDIQHLSCYSLQIEENTIFFQKNYKNLINNDLEAKMYRYIVKTLNKNQFKRYEISNFAKKGFQSKHNLVYWNNQQYYGVGLYASGYCNNYRYTNTRNFQQYLLDFNKKEYFYLTKKDVMFEQIMLNLRLDKGLNINKFNKIFSCDFFKLYAKQISYLSQNKLIKIIKTKIKTTLKGSLLLNVVLELFLD